MRQQVNRLQGQSGGGGHGRRGGGRRDELIAAHGYDTKFAMHAARLGFQGVELITTGRLVLPIADPPADWLRAVRRGEVPYEEWLSRVEELDAQLEALNDDGRFRAGPEREQIEAWTIATHLRLWAATKPSSETLSE